MERVFEEGDMALVYLRRERIPVRAYNMLKLKKYGPFKIIEETCESTKIINLNIILSINRFY